MPELPEVEVVRRGVASHVVGRVLREVQLRGHRVARRHPAGPDDLAARLSGRLVVAARRRGKYLWLDLADPSGSGSATTSSNTRVVDEGGGIVLPAPDEALVVHLGMSGQLLVVDPDAAPVPHQHGTFRLESGPAARPASADPALGRGPAHLVLDAQPADGAPDRHRTRELRFVDQRTFGGLALAPLVPDPFDPTGDGTVPEPVAHIAPDPFDSVFDQAKVVAALARRDSAVKRALLDQSLISGIGNIYADEALWAARVHGERICSTLTRPTLARVLDEARAVMTRALAAGGTSFDALYVDVDGVGGYFARSLNAYGREAEPCARCGALIRRESFMNRSSFSCPRCQPRPRSVKVAGRAPTARPRASE